MDSESKYFPDMTPEQIAALTEEQIAKTVNLACAEQGIPVFVECGEPPTLKAEPDQSVFHVGEWYFRTQADADEVASLVASKPRVRRRYEWQDTTASSTYEDDSDRKVEVEIEKLYSPESYLRLKADIHAHKEANDRYEADKKKWETAASQRSKVSNDVWREVYEARESVGERDRIVRTFAKYVELADGNKAVAWKFLKTAEKLTAEQIADMKLLEILGLDIVVGIEEREAVPA